MEFLFRQSSLATLESFLVDDVLKRAFARSLEIMGEAVKQLTNEFTLQHREVDWRGIAGMRDKLIHGYFSVDYAIVWDVAVTRIPKLRQQLRSILGEP
ncbi:MAG: HepT-like ribonuclease domain-containing protein [Spirochaetales bacterium]